MSVYSPDMMVFVDETGSDKRNYFRKYVYSISGKPATNKSPLFLGERVSAKTGRETTNGDTFYDFGQTHLIPHLLTFTNQHSVVVLDNCSIHHCTEVVDTLKEMQALVHFLPPYSQDFEEAFSKVKTKLKSSDPDLDTETAVLASFATITPDDCRGWIFHSGIYTYNTM